ncbi:hypothetical protein YC2023_047789 [Brassica napus]
MERTNSTVPGDYFDCNICLENAQDPLPLIYLNVKECPVCDGKVTDTEVIPVYGNGDDSESSSNAILESHIVWDDGPWAIYKCMGKPPLLS